MQTRDPEPASPDERPTAEPARRRGTLDGMSALLTSRLHVDLQRVSSSLCSQG